MDHQIVITKEDFAQFNKVLKVIYNDISNLLDEHGLINIVIKEDCSIHFNLKKTRIKLTEQQRVLRAIFNFYFFCKKNSHLFGTTFIDHQIHDESWYRHYQEFSEAVKDAGRRVDDSNYKFRRH